MTEGLLTLADSGSMLAVLAFVAAFAGYAVGRRQGKREGYREGVLFSPLEMRRQTWERGHCVVCGRQPSPPAAPAHELQAPTSDPEQAGEWSHESNENHG